MKKVLIISASPREGGNSDLLCDEFARGATEVGHEVEKIRLAKKKVGYCTGCYACQKLNRCVQNDDANELVEKMLAADVIVLARKEWANRVYDGSLVMGNLMLAAHSLGLGSIWIHRAKEEFESAEGKAILKTLGVCGEWEGIGHCAVGYADCDLPKPPPRKEGRVFRAR